MSKTRVQGRVLQVSLISFAGKEFQKVILEDKNGQIVCIIPTSIRVKSGDLCLADGLIKDVRHSRVMLNPKIIVEQEKTKPRLRNVFFKLSFGVAILILFLAIGVNVTQKSSARNNSATNTANTTSTTANRVNQATQSTPAASYKVNDELAADTPKYTPYDCDLESVPYGRSTKLDSLLESGKTRISTYGINGLKKICYPYGRDKTPTITTVVNAVDQVTSIGTYVAPTYNYTPSYTNSYSGYTNSAGNYVPSPSYSSGSSVGGYSPTAICRDGTYSYSQSRSGTCSSHGGVSSWY